jgi:uncharacterized protein
VTTRRAALQALGAVGGLGMFAEHSLAAALRSTGAGRATPFTQAATQSTTQWATTWQLAEQYYVGLLASHAAQHSLRPHQSLTLPSRGHGVVQLGPRSLLAVAKRPGDWLLRWAPDGSHTPLWQWAEAGRVFNGHALLSPDGRTLYTSETNQDNGQNSGQNSGQGCIGVRDAITLQKRDEWPSYGLDPHALVWDKSSAQPSFIVANGGIATQPETGRSKIDLAHMDSSLVRIDARSGALLGQWRLADPRLSMRHLAWSPAGSERRLGIALQAEHDSTDDKRRAPVLALWDGSTVTAIPYPQDANSTAPSLAGYGGDIAATDDGWAVSCPRADGVAWFAADGAWRGWQPLAKACALVASTSLNSAKNAVWAAGNQSALITGRNPQEHAVYAIETAQLHIDNHWQLWSAA